MHGDVSREMLRKFSYIKCLVSPLSQSRFCNFTCLQVSIHRADIHQFLAVASSLSYQQAEGRSMYNLHRQFSYSIAGHLKLYEVY